MKSLPTPTPLAMKVEPPSSELGLFRSTNRPIFSCGDCKHCGSRWHLTDYCKFKDPTETVVISEYGDRLAPYSGRMFGKDELLSACTGTHYVCGGFVDVHETSVTHLALVCRKCFFRAMIPRIVESIADLGKYFEVLQEPLLLDSWAYQGTQFDLRYKRTL